jgi:hypothetical protein
VSAEPAASSGIEKAPDGVEEILQPGAPREPHPNRTGVAETRTDADRAPSPAEPCIRSELEREEPDPTRDRRDRTRVAYDQRIVALDEEAARVLVGRDLSHGGMRIAPTSTVEIGHVLRLALHSGTDREPLLVSAEARRDDGEDGIVLTFRPLSPPQREHLDKIIDQSGAICVGPESDDESGRHECEPLFVGELLESSDPAIAGSAPPSSPKVGS